MGSLWWKYFPLYTLRIAVEKVTVRCQCSHVKMTIKIKMTYKSNIYLYGVFQSWTSKSNISNYLFIYHCLRLSCYKVFRFLRRKTTMHNENDQNWCRMGWNNRKLSKMIQNWARIGWNDTKWSKMIQNWARIGWNDTKWSKIEQE